MGDATLSMGNVTGDIWYVRIGDQTFDRTGESNARRLYDAVDRLCVLRLSDPAAEIARLRKRVQDLEESCRVLMENNGGTIDADATVDGVDYVMVRRIDFQQMAALMKGCE